jgi:alanine-glyoxylate transaminase / serine-glyoxylate transaminase / serine-pyruvate transaminase
VELERWGIDIAYSCTQKCIGAPSGLAPIAVGGSARRRLADHVCRSFYLDLRLLEDYWVYRKYHHTMSASLVYALREALLLVEEEGLEARWARHERHHAAFAAGLEAMGLSLLPPLEERLWTLNAVRVPAGIDEAAVRRMLLRTFDIEIGAGLGPLAGKVWRVGLMGAGSTPQTVVTLLGALGAALVAQGHRAAQDAGVAAAAAAILAAVPASA